MTFQRLTTHMSGYRQGKEPDQQGRSPEDNKGGLQDAPLHVGQLLGVDIDTDQRYRLPGFVDHRCIARQGCAETVHIDFIFHRRSAKPFSMIGSSLTS